MFRDIIHWKANEVIIKAGQKFVVPIQVQRGNSELKYSFQTKDYNISFSIEYINEEEKTIEVIPLSQVNSHLETIEGSIDLPEPGEVVITWDNSFSWMTEKTLLYTIDLSMPPLIDAGYIYHSLLLLWNSLILSRLVLIHTGLENTRGEKEILENEHNQYEENKSTIKDKITELEKELEESKNKLNEIIENDKTVCETLKETRESVHKQEYQLNTYLINSVFTLVGDEILFNLEPGDILNLYVYIIVTIYILHNFYFYILHLIIIYRGCSSNLLLPYTREIEFWESYFDTITNDVIEPITSKCKWLNDYYEGFKSGDYTHIYDNLRSPAQNNEDHGNEQREEEGEKENDNDEENTNESINNNNIINNKEGEETQEESTKSVTTPVKEVAKAESPSNNKINFGTINMEEQYILIDDNEYEKCSITKFGSNGWYKNQIEELSYIIFHNNIPKLVVGPLDTSVLRNMIEQAREHGFLIACPGTEQGHDGYYVNKKGNVSKWKVVNNDWKKVKLS